MSYEMDASTDSCYEGTTCLINKFGVKDSDRLSEIEGRITFAKAVALEQQPINGEFDFTHYRAIHRWLFCDIYDWAGEIRQVNLSKKGTAFTPVNEIEHMADLIFSRIASNDLFKNLPKRDYIAYIVELYCDINLLHPFREGNGRTQRAFFSQLIKTVGYDFSFARMDGDLLMIATIQAAAGVTDLLYSLFDDALL